MLKFRNTRIKGAGPTSTVPATESPAGVRLGKFRLNPPCLDSSTCIILILASKWTIYGLDNAMVGSSYSAEQLLGSGLAGGRRTIIAGDWIGRFGLRPPPDRPPQNTPSLGSQVPRPGPP